MKTKLLLLPLLGFLLTFLCGKGLSAEADSIFEKPGKQKFGFRFVARPLIGVADFGRADFKRDIRNRPDVWFALTYSQSTIDKKKPPMRQSHRRLLLMLKQIAIS